MSYKKMLPLVLAALLLWTVPASAAPETTLKVAVGDPEDSEMGVVGHAFKKYVEEKTGGKVEVQCFYGGSLGQPHPGRGEGGAGLLRRVHGRHRQPRAL